MERDEGSQTDRGDGRGVGRRVGDAERGAERRAGRGTEREKARERGKPRRQRNGKKEGGHFLVVQGLRLRDPTAGRAGWIPGQGTENPPAMRCKGRERERER